MMASNLNTPTKVLKRWVDMERKPKMVFHFSNPQNEVEIPLDETFTVVDNIKGLKTTLYPHQKTVVRAMLDLEMNRYFVMTDDKSNNGLKYSTSNCVFKIKTTAGVLSEAVGSGKTIDLLSVVLMQKIPKIVPDIAEINMTEQAGTYRRLYNRTTSIIRKKFRNILKPTIIFAGVSVVNQWVSAIKTFTTLKVFTVFDVRSLDKLIPMMVNKSINQYDLVIVKNGKISRAVKLPPYITVEKKNIGKSVLYIYNVVANMRNFCWARVVVDDFDTIKLPSNAGIVNGLFTWYISSTKKQINKPYEKNRQFRTTSEMLMYSNYDCGNIMNNRILFDSLNIRNTAEFVKRTNNISSPKFYAYMFANPNNQYMGFLGLIGGSEATEVMEMLNGDAIETAAERLGIKTNSVADIFQLMLGKEYSRFQKSTDVLKFIEEMSPMQGNRLPMSQNTDEDDTYKKSDLFIRREILYNYPNLRGLLTDTKIEYDIIHKTSGFAIERVKSNIKNGECPICASDLNDDEEILILKCCGVIICGMCCFGTIFPKNSANGICSNCRHTLKVNQLIYLNSDFDLDKIVDEKMDDEPPPVKEVKKEKPRNKQTAIIEIINGIKPKERKRVDVNIHNLMKGTATLPKPTYNKVLIFANYEETIKNIKSNLDEHKIEYWQLKGTHKTITEIVEKFTKCDKKCVLIINSTKHCAGLNLQTATDLVFAHKLVDPNVETQVIGRGQRLGRTSQLRVHFIFYQNEYDYMLRNNSIREIPDTDDNQQQIKS
jgi:SNF2 family DNA or RNA helicase